MTTPVDHYGNALQQLRDGGLVIEHIELGRSIRVPAEGDKGSKKSGWYVVHELVLKSGERAYVGRYQNWKIHSEPQSLKFDFKKLSADERKTLTAKAAEAKKAAEAERSEKIEAAAVRAGRMWPKLPTSGSSEYLVRKRAKAYGVRFAFRGAIVVPLHNTDGKLVGLQFIQADGTKKFLTGTPKQGAFHVMEGAADGPIVIVEGYVTGASIHEATGWTVIVAFDAGNLLEVARIWRLKYPERKLVIAGDDDHESSGSNKGRVQATASAEAVQAHLAFPVFDDPKGRTDFNDLATECGLARVKQLLEQALGTAPPAPPEQGRAEWDFTLERLARDFVLIYGTVTVFDEARKKIIGITELRAAAGRKTVDKWLNSSRRRIIDQDQVVFDPSGASDPQTTVNLFRGFPLKPVRGACDKQLELLMHLCGGGEENESYDWVLKWLAYPLQHPGAKMQTALILHGPEGVGKNKFFSAVRQIYGPYGGVIGQNELENRFNGWASAKLFLLGNEVVNRAELYHVKGKLKNMITETEWVIEEKNMPHRFESNHCNFSFFSNAIQPAGLDPDDRRYMIIWTPHPLSAEFYKEVDVEQQDGGIAALYEHLLKVDLGDFTPHTKPLVTEAKRELIELGMDTHERFFRQWKEGELPIDYGPCLSMDLYKGYQRWCQERGERAVAREVVFSATMRKRLPRLRKRYLLDGSVDQKQGAFFLPSDRPPPPEQREAVELGKAVSFFRQQLEVWHGHQ